MSYTDPQFLLLFFPLLLAVYWLFRKQTMIQNAVLLAGSLVFYASFSKRNVLVLLAGILISYWGGILIHKDRKYTAPAVVLNLLPLLFFKYGKNWIGMWYLLMPLGISFYSLQSTSYLIDISRGKIEPERSPIHYALFVSFFPVIVSGPIQKSYQFLPEIKERKSLSYEDALSAVLMFLYGVFLKLVIADRIALFTSPIFEYYYGYEGAVVLVCGLLYSVEIYADFFGYTCMVSGIAGLLGYSLRENFHQPYLAVSIRDFWKRWHMSLTSWLTEYVYFPLGGNRRGTRRKYINILIIFLVSAVWHGNGMQFVIWGLIHGISRILEEASEPWRESLKMQLGIDSSSAGWKAMQRIAVFLLVSIAWVFFRSPDAEHALGFLCQITKDFSLHVFFDGTLYQLSLDAGHFRLLLAAVGVMVLVSVCREKGARASDVILQPLPVRWTLILALLFVILIAGVYGPGYDASNFIYATF